MTLWKTTIAGRLGCPTTELDDLIDMVAKKFDESKVLALRTETGEVHKLFWLCDAQQYVLDVVKGNAKCQQLLRDAVEALSEDVARHAERVRVEKRQLAFARAVKKRTARAKSKAKSKAMGKTKNKKTSKTAKTRK